MLGTVCRLVSGKGIQTLLTAFATVVAQAPRATLVIVGDGPDRASLEQETSRRSLRESRRLFSAIAVTSMPSIPAGYLRAAFLRRGNLVDHARGVLLRAAGGSHRCPAAIRKSCCKDRPEPWCLRGTRARWLLRSLAQWEAPEASRFHGFSPPDFCVSPRPPRSRCRSQVIPLCLDWKPGVGD